MSTEYFAAIGDLYVRCFALCIFGTTSEKAADDKLVNTAFFIAELGPNHIVNGVDWWMGLVVVLTVSGLFKATVRQAESSQQIL